MHAPTFRHEMYEAYKGTRKPMPEELRQQVPVMKDVLKAMGVTIVEHAGLEADDILGTLAKKAQAQGLEVSLLSGDRDLLQIADECCPPGGGYSSFRMVNLAYNSGPMDVLMSDGRVVYSDLRYKEAAAFRRIMPGTYQFFYADTGLAAMPAALDIETLDSAWLGVYPPYETFGSLYLEVSGGEIYTVYLLQSGTGRNKIQNLILVDR